MKIDHIAMYVKDLEVARAFFATYFHAQSGEVYRNPKTGFRSYFLSFEDGTRMELMTRPELDDREKTLTRTGYIHIAFSVGGREEVDRLTQQLRQDGYPVLSGPRTTGDGYYESCILAVEDNQIEITE